MKNKRAIITLFGANLISGVAQGITIIAIPWYFAMQAKMNVFGYIFILANLVALFWVPVAGIIVDRYNRKHIFQILTFTIGSLLLAIGLYGHYNEGLPWYIVGIAFMITFFNFNIHYPTIYAFMQEVTEAKFYNKIASALEIQHQIATMCSGAIAAWLLEGTLSGELQLFGYHFATNIKIPPWPIEQILLLDATTYFIGFLIISTIRFTSLKDRVSEIGGLAKRLQIGYRYLKAHRNITIFGVASHSIFVTVLVSGFFVFPLYVGNHLEEGGDVYATIDMFYGLAAIVAGFVIHGLFKKVSIPIAIGILSFFVGGVYILMFSTKMVVIFYLSGFLIGICNAGSRILRVTYLFKNIPNQVFGRTSSIFTMINIVFRVIFLAIFSIPFFVKGNNVIWICLAMAIFVMISGTILFSQNKSMILQK